MIDDDHIQDLLNEFEDAVLDRDPDGMKVIFDLLLDLVQRSAPEEEEDGEQYSGDALDPRKIIIINPPDWA